jgi:hypothetical protein
VSWFRGASTALPASIILWLIIIIAIVWMAGCVGPGPVQPEPEGDDVTTRAVEACTRKLAQLAAPYDTTGVGVHFEDARPLDDGNFAVTLNTTVDYPSEQKRGRVLCVVSPRGNVRSIT